MTTLEEERAIRTGLEIMVREKDEEIARLRQALTDLAERMEYRGNSIGWIHSKAENYGRRLLEAWEALKAAGIRCDGNTSVAEGIQKLARNRLNR